MENLTNKNLIWFKGTSSFASISAHRLGNDTIVLQFQDRFYSRREKMSEEEFAIFKRKRES